MYQELLSELKALEQSTLVSAVYLTDAEDLDSRVQDIVDLADSVLITNQGACNWSCIEALKVNGFNVTAGEKDSFGWLSGVIHTSKGKIVYG